MSDFDVGARERHKPNPFPNTKLRVSPSPFSLWGLAPLFLDTSTPHLIHPHTILRAGWSRYAVLKEGIIDIAITNNEAMLRGGSEQSPTPIDQPWAKNIPCEVTGNSM